MRERKETRGTRWFLYVGSFVLITNGHFVDQPRLLSPSVFISVYPALPSRSRSNRPFSLLPASHPLFRSVTYIRSVIRGNGRKQVADYEGRGVVGDSSRRLLSYERDLLYRW